MKILVRIMLAALFSAVVASAVVLSPLSTSVSAAGCWYGCTDGPQRNRSGCSVQFMGTVGDGAFGHYQYTCGDQVISCFYKYECDGPAPENPPES